MIEIIRGSQITFYVRLKNPRTKDPIDLTNLTAAEIILENLDGTELTLSLGSGIAVSGNALLGKLAISLTSAQAQALALVQGITLEPSLTFGTADPVKTRILNAYSVVE
jgi:hypothetical protein